MTHGFLLQNHTMGTILFNPNVHKKQAVINIGRARRLPANAQGHWSSLVHGVRDAAARVAARYEERTSRPSRIPEHRTGNGLFLANGTHLFPMNAALGKLAATGGTRKAAAGMTIVLYDEAGAVELPLGKNQQSSSSTGGNNVPRLGGKVYRFNREGNRVVSREITP